MKVSICIPTWEQYGRGVEFLENNLKIISKQTYTNFEVVISDHSTSNEIENICNSYSNRFDVKYIKNNINRGNSPANTNNSILNAKGDIIKIIFQDDFFYTNYALENIVDNFKNNNTKWLVNGCNHTYDNGITFTNFMIPHWNDKIPIGVNTISSPSVLSFVNDNPFFFDEKLVMLMDCELYYQLYIRYGQPTIIADCLITNRIHPTQISSIYNSDIYAEIKYVKNKHKII